MALTRRSRVQGGALRGDPATPTAAAARQAAEPQAQAPARLHGGAFFDREIGKLVHCSADTSFGAETFPRLLPEPEPEPELRLHAPLVFEAVGNQMAAAALEQQRLRTVGSSDAPASAQPVAPGVLRLCSVFEHIAFDVVEDAYVESGCDFELALGALMEITSRAEDASLSVAEFLLLLAEERADTAAATAALSAREAQRDVLRVFHLAPSLSPSLSDATFASPVAAPASVALGQAELQKLEDEVERAGGLVLDMHSLSVAEALRWLDDTVEALRSLEPLSGGHRRGMGRTVLVITGRGQQAGGRAPIRRAVEQRLKSLGRSGGGRHGGATARGLTFREVNGGGAFEVTV